MTRRTAAATLIVLAVAAAITAAVVAASRLRDATTLPFTARQFEDFPAMTADAKGVVWLATVQRAKGAHYVQVDRVAGGVRTKVADLAHEGLTGIDAPDVAPLGDGCVVAFAAEIDARWRVAVAFVDASGVEMRFVETDGNVNHDPAIAWDGERAWVAWQSDATLPRGIYATWIDRGDQGVPERLSAPDFASNNPDVTVFDTAAEGRARILAAWDSQRRENIDLYGALHDGDGWIKEARLTQDARIERHVALDGHTLAWEAQTFRKHRVNSPYERLVFVADLAGLVPHRDGAVPAGGSLLASFGEAGRVTDPGLRLLRPWIGRDAEGRLWLTARESPAAAKHGWRVLAWTHGREAWSEPTEVFAEQGRWRAVPLAWDADGDAFAAVQRDDLPVGWLEDDGKHPGWRSEVTLVSVGRPDTDGEWDGAAAPPTRGPFGAPATDFQLADHMREMDADLPRQRVEQLGRTLSLYWGDFHEHTDMSVCQRARNAPVPDLWTNQRDIEKLDFTAITDHGYGLDAPQWQYAGEQVRIHHDPGRFVAFLGEEWTSDLKPDGKLTGPARYGHRNLIFLDPFHPRFYDAHDGDISPTQLWQEFGDADVLTIPHQLADTGNVPTDWRFHDEHRQPVAEIFQQRGSYEALGAPLQATASQDVAGNFLQDAWARGLTIGVIASADHGGGRGKAGVWAQDLSRASIFEAFRARHTFGTTGPKIALWFGTVSAMQGDVVERLGDDSISFRIRVVTGSALEKVVVLRNNEVVNTIETPEKELNVSWIDPAVPDAARLWYYVRVHRADGHLAWSSPIWFVRPGAR